MGWVGVGSLLAVACCVLYHYPPRSWAPQPSTSARSPEPISAKPRSAPSADAVKARNSPKPPGALDSSPSDDAESTEESQATPKASAPVLNTPTLDIPPLQLDGGSETTERLRQGQMNGSAEQPSNVAKDPVMQPKASSSSLMPPPPLPRLRPTRQQAQQGQTGTSSNAGRPPPRPTAGDSLRPPPSAASSLRPPPSAASSLRVPQSSRPPNNTLSPKPGASKPSSKRAVLEPGYSSLDWAALKSNPRNNLRGANLPPNLIKVTPSMLVAQNGRKGNDAWTSYQGKVYNITPYLPYHPGGKGELLRGAGKDAAKLFFEVHPWVNWDAMLGECLVGILVSENDSLDDTSALDAMD
ncbi:heme steroid binding protein [Aspergillus sp. HF37]|nr:heme steroid binding protein [Aspergillus sp. HF37]